MKIDKSYVNISQSGQDNTGVKQTHDLSDSGPYFRCEPSGDPAAHLAILTKHNNLVFNPPALETFVNNLDPESQVVFLNALKGIGGIIKWSRAARPEAFEPVVQDRNEYFGPSGEEMRSAELNRVEAQRVVNSNIGALFTGIESLTKE